MNILRHIFRHTRSASTSQAPSTTRQATDWAMLSAAAADPLTISTVFRCVRLLSESVANLPLRYMQLRDGTYVDDTESHLHYLLTIQPNPLYSAYDFWAQTVQQLLLTGNAYIIPQYSHLTLEYDSLILCRPGTVTHDTINRRYTVADPYNRISGTYDEDQVIHIRNISLDGLTGISTLTYARLTTQIAATGDNETLHRFANGGNVRGIVGNDTSVRGFGEYQDQELTKTAADLDQQFTSGKKIVSLPGQVKFSQLSLSSTDMQFLESRKFTVREICRFFGVHPSFVFDDTSNNYKSAEMANVAFLSMTLNPLLRKIESELHRKLIAPELCHTRRFEFDRRSLYACDLASRVQYQTATIAAGIYTVNDWRRAENMPPVPQGDQPLVSANLKSLTELTAPSPTAQ